MAKEDENMPVTVVTPKPVPQEFLVLGLAGYTNGETSVVKEKQIDVEAAALRGTKVLKGDTVACYKQ